MTQDITQLGSLLAERRRQLGLSQDTVAEKIGGDKTQINKFESGEELTLDALNKLASALNSEVKVQITPSHKPERHKLLYTMMAISKIAITHGITRKAAAKYLVSYKGIDYLDDFYDVEQTFSFDDCIEDLTTICHKNGGGLVYDASSNRSSVHISVKDRTDEEKDFHFLIDFLTSHLTGFLMRDNPGMSMSEAVEILHNSEWYEKVSNPKTRMYIQSDLYNYELLKRELKYGSLG